MNSHVFLASYITLISLMPSFYWSIILLVYYFLCRTVRIFYFSCCYLCSLTVHCWCFSIRTFWCHIFLSTFLCWYLTRTERTPSLTSLTFIRIRNFLNSIIKVLCIILFSYYRVTRRIYCFKIFCMKVYTCIYSIFTLYWVNSNKFILIRKHRFSVSSIHNSVINY